MHLSEAKRRCVEKARAYVIPGRVRAFEQLDIMPVLASAQGYRFRDVDGREYQDFHLNGGTFNLGHRNPELIAVLNSSMQTIGIGNHHFVSCSRADLAERLISTLPYLQYTVFCASGGEAVDVAIKSARRSTKRRKVITMESGYHGRTGLSGAAGDVGSARYFYSDFDDDFLRVPFDDLAAIERALSKQDVAALLLESIPATFGFLVPHPDFLSVARAFCDRYGTLLILDEVQTGLGRTGRLWGFQAFSVEPDIVVIGKGFSGGIYPIAATVLSARAGRWIEENGWGHVSTFGGADPACRIAMRVLEICSDVKNLQRAQSIAEFLRAGLDEIRRRRGYLSEIHGVGLVMGLEFDSPSGGPDMTRELYKRGLWAMFASFNSSVLQFKPGFLVDEPYCAEALMKVEDAIEACKARPKGASLRLATGAEGL